MAAENRGVSVPMVQLRGGGSGRGFPSFLSPNDTGYPGSLFSRISSYHIIKALMEGADGVLVSGCHPGDCHYLTGNLLARRKFIMLKRLLAYMGVAEQRVRFAWISASEGEEFAALIKEITEKVKAVGPFRGFLRKDGEADAAIL